LIKTNILSGLIIGIILYFYQYLIIILGYGIWGLKENAFDSITNEFSTIGIPDNSLILICLSLFSVCYSIGYEFTYKKIKWKVLFTILWYCTFTIIISNIPLYINREYSSIALNIVILIAPLSIVVIRELINHKDVNKQKCFIKGEYKQVAIATAWFLFPTLFYEWSEMNKHRKIALCVISPFTLFIASLFIIIIGFVILTLIAIWSPEN